MANMLFEANEWVSHPDRILAVVGGVGIGGFGLGWLVQMAVRGWTGQQMPRWVVNTLRVAGGGLSGWLVTMWLFSGGGNGMGGPGGWGFGGGNNGNETKHDDRKDKEDAEHRDDDMARKENTLYIEVLGEATLKQIDKKNFDPDRCYRVETPDGPKVLALKQVEDYVKQRAGEKPTLSGVKIVLYDDSPSKYVPKVDTLTKDLGVLTNDANERLTVNPLRRNGNAPVK